MAVFRIVLGLLLLVCIGLFITGLVKRDPRWTRLGQTLLKWIVFAGLGFFGVLFVQRLAGG
jgi:hypothetical protein